MTEEDTKMTDAEETAPTTEKDNDKNAATPPMPPLQAAGWRLERLLGGNNNKDESTHTSTTAGSTFYTNPAKVTRRWLTTSSGASATATLADIGAAAVQLLRPCPELLANFKKNSEEEVAMETDDKGNDETKKDVLTVAARPYEAWLVSLAARCLYKEGQYEKALHLTQQGIDTVSAQFEDSRLVSSAVISALYPLLARLVRWRSLCAEHLPPSVAASLRSPMAHAYNMASLRRDADTQATLLNCMLRDLLHSSQSKYLPVQKCV